MSELIKVCACRGCGAFNELMINNCVQCETLCSSGEANYYLESKAQTSRRIIKVAQRVEHNKVLVNNFVNYVNEAIKEKFEKNKTHKISKEDIRVLSYLMELKDD